MSQPILLKVYGNLSPVDSKLFLALKDVCALAMPVDSENGPVSLKGDLFLLSFEGIFFPLEDFIEVLANHLNPRISGKIDYLDLENWTMTRYLVANGEMSGKEASLNHVMDYSGF